MIGAILSIATFEVIYLGITALDPLNFFRFAARYPYPTFALLRFFFLSLGSLLGVFVAALMTARPKRVGRSRLDSFVRNR